MWLFEFLGSMKNLFYKRVVYLIFCSFLGAILYLFAYQNGKSSSELSCRYEQQVKLNALQRDLSKYRTYWRDSYEQRSSQIQNDIDNYRYYYGIN